MRAGVWLVAATLFGSSAQAEPIDDVRTSMSRIKDVERIKIDLKDASQIKDAAKYLQSAKGELSRLRSQVERAAESTDDRIKRLRGPLVDRVRKVEERIAKAEEKVRASGDQPARARDAQGPIKDALAEVKQLDALVADLGRTLATVAREAQAEARDADSARRAFRSACDPAQSLLDQVSSTTDELDDALTRMRTEVEAEGVETSGEQAAVARVRDKAGRLEDLRRRAVTAMQACSRAAANYQRADAEADASRR